MKIGGYQYLEKVNPEKFLYLKSVFVLKDCEILPVSSDHEIFRCTFEGITMFSESFQKGKYTL